MGSRSLHTINPRAPSDPNVKMKENQTSQKTSTEWDHNLHCTFSILILPDTVGSLLQFEVQDRFYFKNSKIIQHVLFKLWNTLDIITEKNLELF